MIVYPREFDAFKEALFATLGTEAGGARALAITPLSFRDWPETEARVAAALQRAKRQPRTDLGRWLKRQLLRGQYNWSRHYFATHPRAVAVAWNGLTGSRKAFLDGARDAGAPTIHAELAPLPGRVTLDPAGVNAEGSVPRDPEVFRAWAKADPVRSGDGWRQLGENLTARPSRRRDVGQASGALPDTPFLFCPLQVPGDSQITLFSGWAENLDGFLLALSRAVAVLPEGWHLRLKEHPSARSSLAESIAPVLATGRVVLDNATDSFEQLAASRGVVTVNSSMALQAFFFDKPVIVTGEAYFATSGLVTHCRSEPDLHAAFAAAERLTFDSPLRATFMNWLDQEYYPRFSRENGVARADRDGFARVIAQSRDFARPLPQGGASLHQPK